MSELPAAGTTRAPAAQNRVIAERMTVELDSERVLFLIGMRVNKWWKIHRWLPVALAMPRMLRELSRQREHGLITFCTFVAWRRPLIVQYWESFEKLEAYARNRGASHLPAWREFNRRVASNGDVGIWHETYRITPGSFECVYNNMPPIGLGLVGRLVAASGEREAARQRLHPS